jgi:hypothetical protein
MADRAGFIHRRHDGDIAKRGNCCRERVDAVGLDAIVICYEYSGHWNSSS